MKTQSILTSELRPSCTSAAHISTPPLHTQRPRPRWSLGPVQDRVAEACGQGHGSAPQKGWFPLEERPRLAAPSSVLVLGSMSPADTPGPPPTQQPLPPTQVPPRLPLLYSTLGPGSAVTYTAERYSYGRVGQKETQVRRPPVSGGLGPLDQGRDACLCDYRCQLALPPPAAAPALALASVALPLSPPEGTCPQPLPACLTLPPARARRHQPLPPATKLLSKRGTGSPGGGQRPQPPMSCSGRCPRGAEGPD